MSGAHVFALHVCVPATADFFDCRYGCHARNITRMNFAMLIARHLSGAAAATAGATSP